jgi:citrate synthase
MADKPSKGLADVVAASTALSDIDGRAGALYYRGYDIHRLAEEGLYPNVDFFAATVYHYLGIPAGLFTPVFSVSRMACWKAHVIEQHADNRLIRPDSEYIGERGLTWTPLEQR